MALATRAWHEPPEAPANGAAVDAAAGRERMALEGYRKKRDFTVTPEPSGDGGRSRAGALSFVVQKHDASRLHYDFRLELDGVLKSWAVPKGPSLDPEERRLAVHVEDHPLEYGSFEGVIPEGEYGGGTVLLWDRGAWIPEGDPEKGYRAGRLKFGLQGSKLRGGWTLVRMRAREPGEDNWLLIKERDRFARPLAEGDVLEERPESVSTERSLEEIARQADRVWGPQGEVRVGGDDAAEPGASADDPTGWTRSAAAAKNLPGARAAPLPRTPRAQLATLVAEAPVGDDWLHELKFDGYRILARVKEDRVRLLSRNGKDWTDRFPGVADAVAALGLGSAILDGEVVALDEGGVSDFQRLQNSLGGGGGDLRYMVFDLLYLDGQDLRAVPLSERKDLLAALVGSDGVVRYSDHLRGHGGRFYRQACELGVEGILSKRADAPYREGRSRDWLKVKCLQRQEFVVVGYTDPKGSRAGLGALLLGVNDEGGRLVSAGKVGTGFTAASLRELRRRLEPLTRPDAPVVDPPRGAAVRDVHWVEPRLVAEVAFTEWTSEGSIRHPSFQGLREDKAPEEVMRERPGGKNPESRPAAAGRAGRSGAGAVEVAGVRLTSPEKILYAEHGISKLQLARYWESVAELALPHLSQRPLTLVRCPTGQDGDCFFQKKAGDGTPDVIPRVDIGGRGDPEEIYLMVDGLPSLIGLVQLGVLELHVWGARADRLDRPDRLVLDLDPGPGVRWAEVVGTAELVRERLSGLGLESFVKSTGGKGLHVVAPLVRRSGWDDVKGFAKALAEELAREEPDRFTSVMTKSKRKGRIYVDYLRNGWNATAIGPYSTRSRPGAPVAVPLHWEELDGDGGPPHWTVATVPDRLRDLGADPWKEMATVKQTLTVAMLDELGAR